MSNDNASAGRSRAPPGKVADQPTDGDVMSVSINEGAAHLISWGDAKWLYAEDYVALEQRL